MPRVPSVERYGWSAGTKAPRQHLHSRTFRVEITMFMRKILLAAAAVAVGATAMAPTDASARGRGGRGFGGAAIGLGLGLGIAGAGYYGGGGNGYYGGGYPAYGYGSGGCWRRQVVYTPYGPRARRVWVCG